MSDGLDLIDPPGEPVTLGGKTYTVGPLTIGQLPAFARAIKPVSGAIEEALRSGAGFSADLVLDLIAEHGDTVIEAVSIATGIAADEVRKGNAADLLSVVPAVLKANRDFLLGRLTPGLRAAMTAAAGAGSTPPRP